ncbi:molybdopterin-guanine dinucleotide biosynthesis protein B [Vandammella animalimorsus]|nr:molybdopterin-guanine dinucleotide biosynthesis protein B [Vandammella animalimorsus]
MPQMSAARQKVLAIVGRSGSGKTTLIEAILPLLRARRLRVNVIKHSHHDITLEPPGKDSARFRAAGAQEVMIASPWRFAIMHELHGQPEPELAEQLARLAPADLTLLEGFKRQPIAQLEVYRPALQQLPLHAQSGSGIIAVASDAPPPPGAALPWLPLNAPEQVLDFILAQLRLA